MSIAYRPDIDGLRAVAVLSVIAFHAFPEYFPGGFIGVDIFFVISGYLITSILITESKSGSFSLWTFYARRILRIFPALILVLASCLFVGWHILLASEYKQLGKHIAAGAAFLSNYSLWFEAGYFDKASEAKPLLHLWSLGIEEQFYIVWPFVFLLIFKLQKLGTRIVFSLLTFSMLFASVMVFVDRDHAFYSPLSRAWELLAGAMLAFSRLETSGLMKWRKHWLGPAVGLAIAIGGTLVLQARYPFPGLLALVPVVSATLLICADPNSWVNRRVLASPWMVRIGIVSYPLYLWHWPLLSFAFILESGRPSVGGRAMLVGLSFALAMLTYKFVERPIRRISRSLAIGLLVATMVILGLLGKNVDDRDGLERIRYKRMITITESANEDFVDFEKRGLITDRKCEWPFKFPERDVCLTAHSELSPTAAVIGDSHALHAYWGLAQAFDKQGENLILLGRGACVPFTNFKPDGDPNHCQPHIDESLSYIANNTTIKKVVLVYRGRYLPENSSATAVKVFGSGLERTLEILTNAGKEVFYFLPVVEPGFDPKLCLGNLPFGRKPPFSCEILLAEDDKKSELLRSTVLGVLAKYPAAHVVNPNNYLCSNGICLLNKKGHSLFKDENHLSHFGSMLIGGAIDFSK